MQLLSRTIPVGNSGNQPPRSGDASSRDMLGGILGRSQPGVCTGHEVGRGLLHDARRHSPVSRCGHTAPAGSCAPLYTGFSPATQGTHARTHRQRHTCTILHVSADTHTHTHAHAHAHAHGHTDTQTHTHTHTHRQTHTHTHAHTDR